MAKARSLIEDLAQGGEILGQGSFSLDAAKAREKLRKFTLADPHRYVLLLVQAAVLLGATRVEIDVDGDDVCMRMIGVELTATEVRELHAHLFARESTRQRGLQELAFALNAAGALSPSWVMLESVDGLGVGAKLEQKAGRRGQELADPVYAALTNATPGTRVQVREPFAIATAFEAVAAARGLREEQRILRHCCRYTTLPVILDGAPLNAFSDAEAMSRSGHALVASVPLEEGQASVAWSRAAASTIDLCFAEVWMHSREAETQLPHLHWIVRSKGLRKDASREDVVRDETYSALQRHLRQVACDLWVQRLRSEEFRGPLFRRLDLIVLAQDVRRSQREMWKGLDDGSPLVQKLDQLSAALRDLVIHSQTNGQWKSTAEVETVQLDGVKYITRELREESGDFLPDYAATYLCLDEAGVSRWQSFSTVTLSSQGYQVSLDVAVERRRRAWRASPATAVLLPGLDIARGGIDHAMLKGQWAFRSERTCADATFAWIVDGHRLLVSSVDIGIPFLDVVLEGEGLEVSERLDSVHIASLWSAALVGGLVQFFVSSLAHLQVSQHEAVVSPRATLVRHIVTAALTPRYFTSWASVCSLSDAEVNSLSDAFRDGVLRSTSTAIRSIKLFDAGHGPRWSLHELADEQARYGDIATSNQALPADCALERRTILLNDHVEATLHVAFPGVVLLRQERAIERALSRKKFLRKAASRWDQILGKHAGVVDFVRTHEAGVTVEISLQTRRSKGVTLAIVEPEGPPPEAGLHIPAHAPCASLVRGIATISLRSSLGGLAVVATGVGLQILDDYSGLTATSMDRVVAMVPDAVASLLAALLARRVGRLGDIPATEDIDLATAILVRQCLVLLALPDWSDPRARKVQHVSEDRAKMLSDSAVRDAITPLEDQLRAAPLFHSIDGREWSWNELAALRDVELRILHPAVHKAQVSLQGLQGIVLIVPGPDLDGMTGALSEKALLEAALGRGVKYASREWVMEQQAERTVAARPTWTKIELEPGVCVARCRIEKGGMRGEIGFSRDWLPVGAAPSRLVICTQRREVGAIDFEEGLPIVGVLDIDALRPVFDGRGEWVPTAEQRNRIQAAVREVRPTLIAALGEAIRSLRDPALAHRLCSWGLAVVARADGDSDSGRVPEGWGRVAFLPCADGESRPLSDVRKFSKSRGCVASLVRAWRPGVVVMLATASEPGSSTRELDDARAARSSLMQSTAICLERADQTRLLRRLFSDVVDVGVFMERVRVEERADAFAVSPPGPPNESAAKKSIRVGGNVGLLWLAPTTAEDAAVHAVVHGLSYATFVVVPGLTCEGFVEGPDVGFSLEESNERPVATLGPRLSEALRDAVIDLYRRLANSLTKKGTLDGQAPIWLTARLQTIWQELQALPRRDESAALLWRTLQDAPILRLANGRAVSPAHATESRPLELEHLGLWQRVHEPSAVSIEAPGVGNVLPTTAPDREPASTPGLLHQDPPQSQPGIAATERTKVLDHAEYIAAALTTTVATNFVGEAPPAMPDVVAAGPSAISSPAEPLMVATEREPAVAPLLPPALRSRGEVFALRIEEVLHSVLALAGREPEVTAFGASARAMLASRPSVLTKRRSGAQPAVVLGSFLIVDPSHPAVYRALERLEFDADAMDLVVSAALTALCAEFLIPACDAPIQHVLGRWALRVG